MGRLLSCWALFLLVVVLAGCSKPEPPRIVPQKITVTAVRPTGIDLVVTLGVENPNKVDIPTQGLTATMRLDGKYDVGSVDLAKAMTFPAGKSTTMDVPIAIPWQDLSGVAGLALTGQDIPYEVAGTVKLGGALVNVAVPFTMTGSLANEQLVQAAINSLPSGLFPPKP